MSCILRIKRDGVTVREAVAERGTHLSSLLRGEVDTPCGGNGTCGKCRVRCSGALSAPTEAERRLLGGDLDAGRRLACMCTLEGDAEVAVERGEAAVETDAVAASFGFGPAAFAVPIRLIAPTLEAPVPADLALRSALAEAGFACEPDMRAAAEAAALICAGVTDAYAVLYEAGGVRSVVRVSREEPRVLGLAADIGTTTVAVCLLDLADGTALGTDGFENPQRAAGADVISRAAYCDKHGVEELRSLIIDALRESARRLCGRAGVSVTDIAAAALAGNTVMQHIAAGLDPASIAVAPFAAATLFGRAVRASELGLGLAPGAMASLAPCVASYVGGDITAGAVAAGLYGGTDEDEGSTNDGDTNVGDGMNDKNVNVHGGGGASPDESETVLYIDVGTNGEMGLRRGGRFTFAATAAGPAFEGAHIAQGMSALPGAVRGVRFDGCGFELDVCGDAAPRGLCGSGIIDATAALLRAGLLDETGALACTADAPPELARYTEADGSRVRLDAERRVYLCGADIREVQLAKAAVAAGIATLLDDAGITAADIDKVVLAGGFGASINAASACAIGLIPRETAGRVSAVGNTSCAGMRLWLTSARARERITAIAAESRYLELSGSGAFMDAFVDSMTFEESE